MVKSFQEPDIVSTPYFFSTTAAPVAEHFRAAGDYKISSGVIISRTKLNLEIHAFEEKNKQFTIIIRIYSLSLKLSYFTTV